MRRGGGKTFWKGLVTRVAILALLVFVLQVLKMLAGPQNVRVQPRKPAVEPQNAPVPMRPGLDRDLTKSGPATGTGSPRT
jgi:hypothetical protein